VRSSVATVNVQAGSGTTPIITINTQPAPTTNVTAGSISGSLTVAASVTQGATLSYQWYSNTSNSNTGGTSISGATGTSFNIPTTLTEGTYYYFCEVRATGGAISVRSNVARVNVLAAGSVLKTFTENFDNGSVNSLSGWTIVNGDARNKWNVGNGVRYGETGRSIYITTDVTPTILSPHNNVDTRSPGYVHFYRDFHIVSTLSDPATISFNWQCRAVGMYSTFYGSALDVYIIETTVTPIAESSLGNTGRVATLYIDGTTWNLHTITLPTISGVKRVVFTWRRLDGSSIYSPPGAIDNFVITNIL